MEKKKNNMTQWIQQNGLEGVLFVYFCSDKYILLLEKYTKYIHTYIKYTP